MSWALHAGEEAEGFSRKFPGREGAGVGEGAEGLTLHVTLLLPLLEVPQGRELRWVLHPLNDLRTTSNFKYLSIFPVFSQNAMHGSH